MIANCSPADYNFDETLSTLRYAARAKFIKNKPIINEDPKDALLKQYAEEIKQLKRRLEGQGGEIDSPQFDVNSEEINTKLKEKEQELSQEKMEKEKLMQKIKDLEARHVEAKDVHIDEHLKNNVERARMSLLDGLTASQLAKAKQMDDQERLKEFEKSSSNSKEIVDQYKNLVKKYKAKIHSLEVELKDINHENYMDKEILLDDVRVITKENKLLEGIINIMLLSSELESVKEASEYNQEKQEYKIPPFYMKNKTLVFPKLPENQSLEMIKQMQENRNLVFNKDKIGKENKQSNKESRDTPIFKNNVGLLNVENKVENKKGENNIRELIRQARSQQHMMQAPQKEQKRNPRKLQLEPIKKENC